MSNVYLDTSVVVAYYVPEALSNTVEEFLKTEPHPAISQLVEVEFFSAISRRVRTKELSQQDAKQIADLFQSHLANGLYTRLLLKSVHLDLACDWIGRFTLP
ncbi:MAG: type II toxin-antitoxin system VapC family toxin, partial [Phormidesmis sp. CAN_BIN44]|nr:type II toxin-antitoxin system VapC family toxin [Phormidesmis sp. CAN_BIN44]